MGCRSTPIGRSIGILVLWLGCSAVGQAAVSHDAARDWRTLLSPHFAVHYHDGTEALARETVAIAEQVHARLSVKYRWTPAERTDIVVSDEFDLSNGYAQVFAANRMTLFVVPPDELGSLEDHGGWLETLIVHEYAHILHLDKAAGAPRFLRRLFGRHFLLFPNTFQPRWLIEGVATYEETDAARGIGRGQSSYFDMFMRVETAQGIKPLSQINQPMASWPAGVVPYLYGVQFFDFLAERNGEAAIPRLVDDYSDNLLPFFINRNSRRTVGKSLTALWPEFEAGLQRRYEPQLAAIRARGLHDGERVTRHGYLTGASRLLADGRLYYLRFDGASEPVLMVLEAGRDRPRRLADVHYGARLDVHPTAGALIAQPEVHRNANLYFDLYRVDLRSGSQRRLTHGARYRHASFDPSGARIAAVHHRLGVYRLDLLDADGRRLDTLWTGAPGEALADTDWAPNGATLVASVWRVDGGWNLEQFDLDMRRWRRLTDDRAIEMHPRHTPDGQAVLFSSDQDGVYNLRRLDIASGAITTLSNVIGGAFHPQPAADGSVVYYTGYGPEGFDIHRLAPGDLATPAVQPGPSAVVAATPPAPEGLEDRPYSPYPGLRPRWWFPHLVVDSGRAEIGATTSAWDALQRHIYVVDAAYDFDNQWFVGSLDYIYDRWLPMLKLHAARFSELELDADDDPLLVRRADTWQAEVVLPWLRHHRRASLHLTALRERETERPAETGIVVAPDLEDNLAGVALVFDSTRRYPLSISREYGRSLRLVYETSDALGGSDYSGEVYTVDWREYLSLWRGHVLAARAVGGWGTKDPRPFRLGGSRGAAQTPALLGGANLDSPFNQRRYALRGYPTGLASLRGRRMALASLEWRFPVKLVERGFMAPPLGLHQVFGTVFAETASVWDNGDRPGPYTTGAGLEANADLALFYNLGLNLRLGYAHGFDEGGKDQVYLNVGASF
ncbi:MAG TPA: hypothetical protein VGA00_14695 [Acidiferrobacterales bacterium]